MTIGRKISDRRFLSLLLLPILIGGIGLIIGYTDSFTKYRNYVSGQTIPDVLVKSGKTGKEVRMLEYRSLAGFELEGFDRDLAPADMPSSRSLRETAQRTGLPTLSIVLDPDDLLNRDTGLLANYSRRGRSWERPAYVSFFEDGQLQFATGAGLRVHGGASRAATVKSFRIYFRELYGRKQFGSDVLFAGQGDPIRSLIVHNDLRIKSSGEQDEEWRFMNPISYELAREIGCIVPATKAVQFYLNGVDQGLFFLTEHISSSYFQAHFGHDDFIFARTKVTRPKGSSLVEKGSRRKYDEFRDWPKTAAAPLEMEEVAKRVDLEGLTNWMISILYAGVTDPFQGPVLLDESDPNARWFWINWDMDHAFMDYYSQVAHPWEIDNLGGRSAVLNRNRTRSIIFDRLRRESPEYRAYFLTRITEVLNHILTQERVGQLVAGYEGIAISHGIENRAFLEVIKDFVRERPAVLRSQMKTYFVAGDDYRLTISSPVPLKLIVDGYETDNGYSGWYFASTPVSIELPREYGNLVDTWVVNGSKLPIEEPWLKLNLTSDTEVELLLAHSGID